MTQATMYAAEVNSPYTILSVGIDNDDTTITVEELGVFPTAPNIAVLGSGSDAETVLYSAKSAATGAGTLTVTRGWNLSGSYGAAKAWLAGTVISRRFTAYDHDTFKANIEDLNTVKAPLASPALTGTPTAPTAAVGTNTTQIATTAFVQAAFGNIDAFVYKGVINCSTNPNYPAADAGYVYKVSVAGKIGGASGINVEVGDTLICLVDSSATGDQAAVGANWNILQVNIDGAVFTSDTPERGDILYRGASGYALLHHGTSGQYLKTQGDGADPTWADIVTVAALDDLTDVAITSAEQGDILYRGASGWVNMHHGTDGQVLTCAGHGADPAWEDLPAAGGSIADPASKELGDILYYDGSDWVLLHHGTDGQVLTSGGHGVSPAWEDPAAGSGNVATDTIWDAAGDLVVGTGANTAARLAKGTANQILHMKSDASTVEWTNKPTEISRLAAIADTASFATSDNDDGITGDTDLGVGHGIISRIRIRGSTILGQRTAGSFLINDANGIEPADTSLAYDGLTGTLPTAGAEGTGDYIYCEGEIMRVAAGTSTPLTVVRGCMGTKAAFHDDNAVCYTLNEGARLRLFLDSNRKTEECILEWRSLFLGKWTTDAAVSANDTFITLTAAPNVLPDFGRGSLIVIDPAGTIEYATVQKVIGSVSGTTWDDSIRVEKALAAHDTSKDVYRVCQFDIPIPFKFASGTTLYWTLYIDQLAAATDFSIEFIVEGVS